MMRSPVLLAFMLCGCLVPEGPDTSTVVSEICTASMACTNSPELLHYGMHELSLLGAPNGQNAAIQLGADGRPALRKGSQTYRLDIVGGQIVGRDSSGNIALKADQTVGAEFSIINYPSGPVLFVLHIETYREDKYVIGPPGALYLYKITWHDPGGSARLPACNPSNVTYWTSPKWDPLMGMEQDELLLFDQERVNAPRKTLDPDKTHANGWITFGCAGGAIAKLDLTANTRHRQPLGMDNWAARQATLKLYVADYCGKGTAYTFPGVPLVWTGLGYTYGDTPGDIEARWTEAGATCVSKRRLIAHPDQGDLGPISCHDTMPTCTNTDVMDLAGNLRVTANYYPPM
jgi:ADYC domain-containing protein